MKLGQSIFEPASSHPVKNSLLLSADHFGYSLLDHSKAGVYSKQIYESLINLFFLVIGAMSACKLRPNGWPSFKRRPVVGTCRPFVFWPSYRFYICGFSPIH